MNIYLLEKASANYYKHKGNLHYPVEAFEQGKAFEVCTDTEVVEVFETKEEALKEFENYSTLYNEYSGGGRKYLQVDEYRLYECNFSLDQAVEEEEYKNIDECLKAFRNNISDFWDYIDYSGWSWGDSIGTLTAWVKTEENESGKISTKRIEKEFKNDSDFNAFEEADCWANEKYEELEQNEDITGIYPVDCGVSY